MSKKKRRSLDQDAGYKPFRKRYKDRPVLFFSECLGVTLSWQQLDIVEKLHPDNAKVSVSSGHGTGKGYVTAAIVIHFVLMHPQSLVMLTANNIDQVQKVLFKYIRVHWRRLEAKHPEITKYFTITATTLYETISKESWSVFGKTSSKGNEEALAGQHAEDMLVIVDEASGVSDKAFDTIWGIFTQRNNKILLTSQFTRPSGHFADSQTRLAKTDGNPDGLYDALTLNSEESDHVTNEAIANYIRRFGGRSSPEYGIRVLGVCPDNAEGFLIPRSLAATGFDNEIDFGDQQWGYLGLVDVSTDGYRDQSEVTICRVAGDGEERLIDTVFRWTATPGIDGIQLAHELGRMEAGYPNITWGIDAGGYGTATCQEAERLGLSVYRINWGKRPHSPALQKRFNNLRTYSSVMVRDALWGKRIKLLSNNRKDHDKTLDQFSKLPYRFNEQSQWQMESKQKMREDNIKSPDIFDTYAFAFLVQYIPAGEEVATESDPDSWADGLLGIG